MDERRRLEAYVRIAQDDDEPDPAFCTCEEMTDGFYQCPQCREWIAAKLKAARERERRATDVPEEPCPI